MRLTGSLNLTIRPLLCYRLLYPIRYCIAMLRASFSGFGHGHCKHKPDPSDLLWRSAQHTAAELPILISVRSSKVVPCSSHPCSYTGHREVMQPSRFLFQKCPHTSQSATATQPYGMVEQEALPCRLRTRSSPRSMLGSHGLDVFFPVL